MHSRVIPRVHIVRFMKREAQDAFAIPAAFTVLDAKAGAGDVLFYSGDGKIVVAHAVVKERKAPPGPVVMADGEAPLKTAEPSFITGEGAFLVAPDAGHAA